MKYYWVILFTSFFSINSFGQSFCRSITPSKQVANKSTSNVTLIADDSYEINIFFHIMVLSHEGREYYRLNDLEISKAFNVLIKDFSSHNICLNLSGVDEIILTFDDYVDFSRWDNSKDLNNNGKFDSMEEYCQENRIDVFIYKGGDTPINGGVAIPNGSSYVVGGVFFNHDSVFTSVSSHELGHCLGLLHTFAGSPCSPTESSSQELVDGSNSLTSGDYVEDTPADASDIYDCIEEETCTWTGCTCSGSATDANGDTYSPDTRNIMAYTVPSCFTHFTPGQGQRMRNTIANTTVLLKTVVPKDLTFSDLIVLTNDNLQYKAQNNIVASTNVIVNPLGQLTFESGDSVLLKSGFEANKQSDFEAVIKAPCVNNFSTQSKTKVANSVEHHNEGVAVFPNPNNGSFTINLGFENKSDVMVSIYDVTGKQVYTAQSNQSSIEFNMPDLIPGLYIVKLNGESVNETIKFIKE
jgi:hypothetical protein